MTSKTWLVNLRPCNRKRKPVDGIEVFLGDELDRVKARVLLASKHVESPAPLSTTPPEQRERSTPRQDLGRREKPGKMTVAVLSRLTSPWR